MSTRHSSSAADIKRAQRESVYLREFSKLFHQLSLDHPELQSCVVTRASFSKDKSACTFFFYTPDGLAAFEPQLEILKLYKPSLRSALAKLIPSRRVPNIVFKFDAQREKVERINVLLHQIGQEES